MLTSLSIYLIDMDKKLVIFETDDYYILMDGNYVIKDNFIKECIVENIPLNNYILENTPETNLLKTHIENINIFDNVLEDIQNTYTWNIPDEYKHINILETCLSRLVELNLDNEKYLNRLEIEINLVSKKKFDMFFKCLIYITDTFKKHKIIYGVGRGSSCASLVLYLLGINKVDPVKYNINYLEFYKSDE